MTVKASFQEVTSSTNKYLAQASLILNQHKVGVGAYACTYTHIHMHLHTHVHTNLHIYTHIWLGRTHHNSTHANILRLHSLRRTHSLQQNSSQHSLMLLWKRVVYSTFDMKNGSTQQQTSYRMMGPNKFAAWNKHVHLKGLPENIWLLSQMWWSWIMQSDSVLLVMGPNRIPRTCGLVNCLSTVFLYNWSQSHQNSCQTWVNSLAETFRMRLQVRHMNMLWFNKYFHHILRPLNTTCNRDIGRVELNLKK